MSDAFIGEIKMFAGTFAPRNWAFCNGQSMAIQQNAALFAIIGTAYGGDGVTTFSLPDLRSRVPVHAGQGTGLSNYFLGEKAGIENETLLYNNMPIHSHSVNAVNSGGNQASPASNYPAVESTGTSLNYSNGPANSTMSPTTISNAGGNVPFSIIQPVLCVTFIIALVGIFPSRN